MRTSRQSSRRFARQADGLICLDQHTCCGDGIGLDVTGPYWIFAVVTIHRGNLSYLHGRAIVPPPHARFAVFLPPYSVVQCRLEAVRADSQAVASRRTLSADLPRQAVAFRTSIARLPSSVPQMLPPLRVLAEHLRVSPAVMSRCFTRDYGMPPVQYRHAIRVMDALIRLINGERICDVAGSVGFHDLGQFYRQFGRLAAAPPGHYRHRSGQPGTGTTRAPAPALASDES